MYDFPKTEKALKKRISSYKASLLKEQEKFGYVNDGAGKRYLLFPLYLALNNMEEANDTSYRHKLAFLECLEVQRQ